MKRLHLAAFAILAFCVGMAFVKPASADPTFTQSTCGQPGGTCSTLIYDLNTVGAQLSVSNLPFTNNPNCGSAFNCYCTATFYSTAGTWTADVYTSATQAFTAVTKVGALVQPTSAPQTVTIPIASGSGITAVRVQQRTASASVVGPVLVGLDCNNNGQVWAPSAEPTPTATP